MRFTNRAKMYSSSSRPNVCRCSVTKPAELEVFEGKLTTRARMRRLGLLLTAPGMLWLVVFLLLPIVGLIILAFAQRGAYGCIDWSFSFANRKKSSRALLLALVMVPSCTNLVIRTYAWMLVLGSQMPPAWIARAVGLIGPDDALYPGTFAIYIGMLGSRLPFAVLPLYTSVERLNWNIVEAARDLYASPFRVFYHGILSQMMPGIIASVILTLVPSLGMYVVSDLLGGAKYMLIGNLIQQQFGAASDWPFGAMLGIVLIISSVVSLAVFSRVGGGRNYV